MEEFEGTEQAPDLDDMADTSALTPAGSDLTKRLMTLVRMARMPNVAEALDETELQEIGKKVKTEYDLDLSSRDAWEARAKKAMEIAKQIATAKSFPWPDASNVKYPLLTTAALQFAARAYPAICDGPRVVKCQVMGADADGKKSEAAERISQHMSYQLLYETSWEADIDTLLHQLPIIGCVFKKVYRDGTTDAGFCDDLVSAFDLIVNQSAKDLETVPRITHRFPLYPHLIQERQREGRFLDVDIHGDEDKDAQDDHAPHQLLEQHRYLDLDDDGVLEPWIVTVHEKSAQVLRIVPGFDADEIQFDAMKGKILRIKRKDYFVKIPFIPDPEGGFYDLGYGHLLEHVGATVDTSINQMNDAATMQNSGGGFIGGSVDIGKGKATIRMKPGEYIRVNGAGDQLRNAIVPYQHPGPSAVSMQLLELMLTAGKDIASVQDILVGDNSKTMTATATMALIEQGLKVFTAIYKRIFRALKQEFRLIFEINKKHLDVQKYLSLVDVPQPPPPPPQMMGHNGGPPMGPSPEMPEMQPGMPPTPPGAPMPGPMPPDGQMMPPQGGPPPQPMPQFTPLDVVAQDYQGQMDIMPVADPSNVTDMQRMAKAQFVMEQIKEGNPYINGKLATKRALEAARIERVEELIQDPPPPPPDPAVEKTKADMEAKRETAQINNDARTTDLAIKQESANIDLTVKSETARMTLEGKERDLAAKERELAIREREMQGQAALNEATLATKWKELDVREAELEVTKAEIAARKSKAAEGGTADAD